MIVQQLDDYSSAWKLFKSFSSRPYCFFLDSGQGYGEVSRFSFIGADPFIMLRSKGTTITVIENDNEINQLGCPFEALHSLLDKYTVTNTTDIPFIGGAVGSLGYELGQHIEKLPKSAQDDRNIDDMILGFYDGIIAIDHFKETAYIIALGISAPAEKRIEEIKAIINTPEASSFTLSMYQPSTEELPTFTANFTKIGYLQAIDKVKHYIAEGDVYEVCLTQRFETELTQHPLEIYTHLRSINPVPFGGYFDFGDMHVLCSSPERFLMKDQQYVETRPIKGTRRRSATKEEDEALYKELLNSEKDRAELLMIIDLCRNDLGRIAKFGTLKEENLFKIKAYPTVFHYDAVISAQIQEGYSITDVIKAAFPGGSITGAPKIRSMEIIDELEPTQRNIYTGSIGYIAFDGQMDLNIAIRTLICKDNKAYIHAGGAIVWDSCPEDEYQETLDKGKAHIEALQQTAQHACST